MIITKTPLRISLFGGGSDFPEYFNNHGGGMVISFTIDKYVYVTVSRRHDDLIRLSYSQTELVSELKDIKHDLIRLVMALTGIKQGLEIQTRADITGQGSGLGSSAAVTIGTLVALNAISGNRSNIWETCESATYIERVVLERPIGYQDQYAIGYGGLNRINFSDQPVDICRYTYDSYFNVDIHPLINRLHLYATGQTRKSSHILKEQNDKTAVNAPLIGKLVDIALLANDAILAGNYNDIGPLLDESWQLKRQLASGITNSHIDKMYDKAMAAGATGGKICGAGGGGYLLVYVPEHKEKSVKNAMSGYKELKFNFEPRGSRVIFDDE